jgi:hypothetical protein
MHWDPALLSAFLVCTGIATGSLARCRGRSFIPWFIVGALVWFVAIPWLLLTKRRPNDRAAPARMMLVSLVATGCAAAVLLTDLVLLPAPLPDCDYYSNISVLNKAAPKPSVDKAAHEIITIDNAREVSRSKSEIQCTGTARFTNSTTIAIKYRLFIEDGRLLGETYLQ